MPTNQVGSSGGFDWVLVTSSSKRNNLTVNMSHSSSIGWNKKTSYRPERESDTCEHKLLIASACSATAAKPETAAVEAHLIWRISRERRFWSGFDRAHASLSQQFPRDPCLMSFGRTLLKRQ
eukprot:7174364-Prymnesium_polylepis.3